MSVTATNVHPDGNYDIEPFVLADTNETTVLSGNEAYAGGLLLTEIWLADDAGEARTVTIKLSRAGTEITLVYQAAIATSTPLVFPFNGPILKKTSANTDTLKVTASAGGVHGYVAYQGIRSSS